jgi:ferric-dicitrate binding protein FerR (iron transport regulator)
MPPRRSTASLLVAGRDLAAPPAPPHRRRVRPASAAIVATGAVCAALLLVVLRTDATRLRYQHAEAVRREQSLRDQQQRLTVEVRHLRHPLRLEEIGRELGLESATCLIDLAAPRPCPLPAAVAASPAAGPDQRP